MDELRQAADNVRSEAKAARPDVAKVIRTEQFDETVFGDFSARIDEARSIHAPRFHRRVRQGSLGPR